MEWWGLPTRLEWALAPDRGALGYQTGSLAARMAFGRLRGPWVQELKSSGGVLYSVQSTLPEAGGQSPGRVLGATPWGPLAAAIAVAWADLHVNLRGCTPPRTLFAARGVQWPSGLPGKKKGVWKPPILPSLFFCYRSCKNHWLCRLQDKGR